MRRADFASEAEYYRAHRKVFLLAQELGVTPIEAERRMKAEEARMRHAAARERLHARMNAPLAPAQPAAGSRPRWDSPWMMNE